MIEIYADGACSGNPGIGGSSIVVVENNEEVFSESYAKELTTNNERELYAVFFSLMCCSSDYPVTIYSDSQYVVRGINEWIPKWKENGWKNSKGETIKNFDLWQCIYKQMESLTKDNAEFSIQHIPGHSGNKWNDRADKLAKNAIKIYKNEHSKE